MWCYCGVIVVSLWWLLPDVEVRVQLVSAQSSECPPAPPQYRSRTELGTADIPGATHVVDQRVAQISWRTLNDMSRGALVPTRHQTMHNC